MIPISQRLQGLVSQQPTTDFSRTRPHADPCLDELLNTHMDHFYNMVQQLNSFLQEEPDPRKVLIQDHADEAWYMYLPFRRSRFAWMLLHHYPDGQLSWQPAFQVPDHIEAQARQITCSWISVAAQ